VDDHALLEAARGGDEAALETFIERHQSRVLLRPEDVPAPRTPAT
jgi:hypothetical protein